MSIPNLSPSNKDPHLGDANWEEIATMKAQTITFIARTSSIHMTEVHSLTYEGGLETA